MKLEISGEGLADALALAGSVVPSRSSREVLTSILIVAEPHKQAEIIGSNMEVGIRIRLDGAKVEGKGAICVPLGRLGAIASELRGLQVTLEPTETHHLKITAPGSSFKLVGHAPEDFPRVPEMPEAGAMAISPIVFGQLIRRTSFCVSPEESRYAIHGLMMKVKGKALHCIATDGKRMAWNKSENGVESAKREVSALLPSGGLGVTLKRASDMLDATKQKIEMVAEERRVIFRCGPITIAMQKVQGTFPEYEKVIPSTFKNTAVIDRAELHGAIRLGALLASEGSHAIEMCFVQGEVKIGAQVSNVGEGRITVPIHKWNPIVPSEAISVHFNPRYVEQFLKLAAGDEVQIHINDARSAVLFEGEEDFRYVVMPITLESTEQ